MGRTLLLLMLLLCAALPAGATRREVVLGATTALRYSNQSFNDETSNTRDWGTFEIGPFIRFRSEANTYDVGLQYSPSAVFNTRDNQEDYVKQRLRFTGGWRPSSRLSFVASDYLTYDAESNLDFIDDGTGNLVADNQPVLRNTATLGMRTAITPLFSLNGDVSHQILDYSRSGLSDSTTLAMSGDLRYVLGQRNSLGAGVSATYQSIELTTLGFLRPGTTSGFYQFFVLWDHSFNSWLRLNFRGGPTWIQTQVQDSGIPGSNIPDSDDVTFFASVSMNAEWRRWEGQVSYRRSQGTEATSVQSQILDVVSLSGRYDISKNWAGALRFSWSNRVSLREDPRFGVRSELEQFLVAATATRRIGRYLLAHLTVDYTRQNDFPWAVGGPGSDPITRESDRFRVFLRFDYSLAPFRF